MLEVARGWPRWLISIVMLRPKEQSFLRAFSSSWSWFKSYMKCLSTEWLTRLTRHRTPAPPLSLPSRVGDVHAFVCFFVLFCFFLLQARGRSEVERLGGRLRDEEGKAAAAAAKFKTLEQRARFLETGAAAARQRAEAGARMVCTSTSDVCVFWETKERGGGTGGGETHTYRERQRQRKRQRDRGGQGRQRHTHAHAKRGRQSERERRGGGGAETAERERKNTKGEKQETSCDHASCRGAEEDEALHFAVVLVVADFFLSLCCALLCCALRCGAVLCRGVVFRSWHQPSTRRRRSRTG